MTPQEKQEIERRLRNIEIKLLAQIRENKIQAQQIGKLSRANEKNIQGLAMALIAAVAGIFAIQAAMRLQDNPDLTNKIIDQTFEIIALVITTGASGMALRHSREAEEIKSSEDSEEF